MEFGETLTEVKSERHSGRVRKRIKITTGANEELQRKYPHNLTFYLDPPTDSISLKEFEEYAVARLSCKGHLYLIQIFSVN